jgi:MFS family permease
LILDYISKSLGISSKKLFAITIVNSGTLSWYMFLVNFQNIFENLTNNESWIFTGSFLFYLFAVLSAIIGSMLSEKINRRKLLSTWIIFGVLTTSTLIFFPTESFILIFGPLLGISLGLGFPFSLTLFADNTTIKNRSRVSGIILLQTFIMLSIAVAISEMLELGFLGTIILLITLRSTSLLALKLDECKVKIKPNNQITNKWIPILTYKPFVLYFLPWLMFIIAAVLTDHLIWPELILEPQDNWVFEIGNPLHYLATAICSITSGIIGDRYGRRIPVIIGLAILGFSFALLGYEILPIIVFIHLMAIGTAFGFIWVIYIAIPGDIAMWNLRVPFSREKFYAIITILPLTVYGGLGAIPRMFGITAQPNLLSPILSIILFMSVILILQAPETLPKEIVEKIEYDEHIRKVKKVIEKDE